MLAHGPSLFLLEEHRWLWELTNVVELNLFASVHAYEDAIDLVRNLGDQEKARLHLLTKRFGNVRNEMGVYWMNQCARAGKLSDQQDEKVSLSNSHSNVYVSKYAGDQRSLSKKLRKLRCRYPSVREAPRCFQCCLVAFQSGSIDAILRGILHSDHRWCTTGILSARTTKLSESLRLLSPWFEVSRTSCRSLRCLSHVVLGTVQQLLPHGDTHARLCTVEQHVTRRRT